MKESGQDRSIVFVLGPSPDQIGGMAEVVRQHLRVTFDGRFTPVYVAGGGSDQRRSRLHGALRHVRSLWQLFRTVRAAPDSLVHIHSCSGFTFYRNALDVLVARLRGRCIVLHLHGGRFDAFYGSANALGRFVIRRVLRVADRVVAVSKSWAGQLRSIEPRANVRIVPNVVAIPADVPARKHNGRCRFLFLSTMDTNKGVDVLLSACRTVPGGMIEVMLAGPAGTAGDAARLERRIREHGLECVAQYVGPVVGEAKRQLLETHDVLVLPSDYEGMPLCILEAFAHGLPVIATHVGGVVEMMEDRVEGLLIEPRNADQLACAMEQLARNPALRASLGHAGRRRVQQHHSLALLEQNLAALYAELIKLRDPAPQSRTRRLRGADRAHSSA